MSAEFWNKESQPVHTALKLSELIVLDRRRGPPPTLVINTSLIIQPATGQDLPTELIGCFVGLGYVGFIPDLRPKQVTVCRMLANKTNKLNLSKEERGGHFRRFLCNTGLNERREAIAPFPFNSGNQQCSLSPHAGMCKVMLAELSDC